MGLGSVIENSAFEKSRLTSSKNKEKGLTNAFSQPLSYPRAESNRNRQNRNLKFYPLNYGGKWTAKIRILSRITMPSRIFLNFEGFLIFAIS